MNQTENKNRISNKFSDGIQLLPEDVFRGVKKFGWLCVVLALLFSAIVFADGYRRYVPRYTAEATFTVSTQNNSSFIGGVSVYSFYYDAAIANQLTETFPLILNSNLLQEAVCEDLNFTRMPASLSAKAVEGTNMFTLSATGTDPQTAYDVLLSAIENYPDVAKYAIGNVKITIITSPTVPTEPSNTLNYMDKVLTAACVGVCVGCVLIFLYAYQRNTIKSKRDIKSKLGHDAVGTLPRVIFKKHTKKIDQSILCTNPKIDGAFVESVRVFKNVFKNSLKSGKNVVIGTSTAPGEGKTTVITNLALSLVESDKKVLLVDGDLRNPSVAALLGINPDNIEYEVVTNSYKIACLKKYGIYFMLFNTGDEKRFKYMNSAYVKEIFDSLRDSYDYILVDTPPCGLVSDALFFAQAADVAFYVVLQDAVRISKIQSGLDNLMSTDIKIMGCVINGVEEKLSLKGYGYGYGYGYRYGYGYGKSKKKYGE